MPQEFKLELDRRFKQRVRGRYEKYEFEVGVLKDGPHYWPSYGPLNHLAKKSPPRTRSYAGGPVRAVYRGRYRGQATSGTHAGVSESLRKKTGINFYTRPFRSKNNKEILAFTREFLKSAGSGKQNRKRIENLLQAIVRNPILRGDYGRNSFVTARIKGFNRFMIDTGQLFKNIIARTRIIRRVSK